MRDTRDTNRQLHLHREVIPTLALKVLARFIMWAVWFSAADDVNIGGQKVASKIFSQLPQKEKESDHSTLCILIANDQNIY